MTEQLMQNRKISARTPVVTEAGTAARENIWGHSSTQTVSSIGADFAHVNAVEGPMAEACAIKAGRLSSMTAGASPTQGPAQMQKATKNKMSPDERTQYVIQQQKLVRQSEIDGRQGQLDYSMAGKAVTDISREIQQKGGNSTPEDYARLEEAKQKLEEVASAQEVEDRAKRNIDIDLQNDLKTPKDMRKFVRSLNKLNDKLDYKKMSDDDLAKNYSKYSIMSNELDSYQTLLGGSEVLNANWKGNDKMQKERDQVRGTSKFGQKLSANRAALTWRWKTMRADPNNRSSKGWEKKLEEHMNSMK